MHCARPPATTNRSHPYSLRTAMVSRCLRTIAAASSCELTSSLARSERICVRTVAIETTRCSAIFVVRCPSANKSRTSRSREVSRRKRRDSSRSRACELACRVNHSRVSASVSGADASDADAADITSSSPRKFLDSGAESVASGSTVAETPRVFEPLELTTSTCQPAPHSASTSSRPLAQSSSQPCPRSRSGTATPGRNCRTRTRRSTLSSTGRWCASTPRVPNTFRSEQPNNS